MDLLGPKRLTIGNRIKQARKYRGMTLVQLAERVSVSQAILSRWETGNRICRLHQLVKIAKILNVPLPYLTEDNVLIGRVGRQYRGTWTTGRFD